MLPTKLFDRTHLKVAPELQDEIIMKFNNYDLLIRVMNNAATNIKTMLQTTKDMNFNDKEDLYYIAKLLKDAQSENWQAANSLYY